MSQLEQTWILTHKSKKELKEIKGNIIFGSRDDFFKALGIPTPKRDEKDFESIKKLGQAIREDFAKMRKILS